jgi:HSP20 family molecular chaperone IbpA
MLLDLYKFYKTFPNYEDFRIPMWSESEEKDNNIILSIAVPGFEKEDFNLYVEDNTLFLEITTKKKSLKYRVYDSVLNLKKAEAEYKNGVLVITIPKREVDKKKLSIKVL